MLDFLLVIETNTAVKLWNDYSDSRCVISFVFTKFIFPQLVLLVDSSENIKKYYQRSSSAEKKTNGTTSIINNSEKTRNDLLTILDTLTSKENSSLEKLKQIKIPDIQILKQKVNIRDGVVNNLWFFRGIQTALIVFSCLRFYFFFIFNLFHKCM